MGRRFEVYEGERSDENRRILYGVSKGIFRADADALGGRIQ